MKKYIIITSILASTVGFTLAQNVASTTQDSQCISLSNNLTYNRSTDKNTKGDVTKLQMFLKSQNFLKSNPTGNFGPLTLQAVKLFQKQTYANISESNIDTTLVLESKDRQDVAKTGFLLNKTGYVGIYTRAKIAYVSCNKAVVVPNQVVVSPVVSAPNLVAVTGGASVKENTNPRITLVTVDAISSNGAQKTIQIGITGYNFDKTSNSVTVSAKSGEVQTLTLPAYPIYKDGDGMINFQMTDFRKSLSDTYTLQVTAKGKVSNIAGVTSEKK